MKLDLSEAYTTLVALLEFCNVHGSRLVATELPPCVRAGGELFRYQGLATWCRSPSPLFLSLSLSHSLIQYHATKCCILKCPLCWARYAQRLSDGPEFSLPGLVERSELRLVNIC